LIALRFIRWAKLSTNCGQSRGGSLLSSHERRLPLRSRDASHNSLDHSGTRPTEPTLGESDYARANRVGVTIKIVTSFIRGTYCAGSNRWGSQAGTEKESTRDRKAKQKTRVEAHRNAKWPTNRARSTRNEYRIWNLKAVNAFSSSRTKPLISP